MKNYLSGSHIRLSVLLSTLVLLCRPSCGPAEELRMYAAAGLKAPLIEMAAEFEKSHGQKIALVFDTAGGAEKLFLADSGAVLLITSEKLTLVSLKLPR